jgi:hypothetical protein
MDATFVTILVFYVLAVVVILWVIGSVPRPKSLRVKQIGRDVMADVLVYKVSVGPVTDKDVVERQLAVAVDGVAVGEVKVFSADSTDLGEIRVKQDDKVVLTLVDVDDAGNRSEPAVFEFVARDTLPPAQPGAFGVTLVAEEEEEVEVEVEEDEGEEPAAPETPVEPEAPAVEPETPSEDA